jgi:hypothetical protein
MLTRHWYDRDTVVEALHHAAATWRDPLRKQKLLFWTYELVLSEEWDILWETLERVALRWGDSVCLSFLRKTQDGVLDFLHSLLSLPVPVSYEPPVAVTDVPEDPAVPEKPVAWTGAQRTRLLHAVRDAMVHRRPLRLLKLLGGLHFQHAAPYLGLSATASKKGIYHMLEMVGLPVSRNCLAPLKWPDIPIGRIAARLFSVPRSLVPKGPIDPLATKEGCAFWRRLWATVEEDILWNTYFIDDIPDEWSAAEQAKSHI